MKQKVNKKIAKKRRKKAEILLLPGYHYNEYDPVNSLSIALSNAGIVPLRIRLPKVLSRIEVRTKNLAKAKR
jgi:hypothetical protein